MRTKGSRYGAAAPVLRQANLYQSIVLTKTMKAALPVVVLLATASACRATAPTDRNTLPNHRAVTETTIPETAEPSRKAGLELPAPHPPR